MWKAYSQSALRNNRAASAAIMTAVFISALFISMIIGVFYNMWTDNIRRIVDEEGGWQGKLVAQWTEDSLRRVENAPNVERAVLAGVEEDGRQALEIYLENPRTIYEDLPRIAEEAGIDSDGKDLTAIQYNNLLLSQYYIYSPEEKKDPPMLLSFYICVMVVVCFLLVLVIYNAFGVSMNARIHQLGILQSVGATPGQIRTALVQEALALSLLPMLAGIAAGVGLDAVFVHFSNFIGAGIQRQAAVFDYSPWVFLAALAVCLITVGISAWVPARRLSRMTPLEAIRGGESRPVKKVRAFRILSKLFGLEGELARKSLYVRRRAFRTATVSLTLSFLVFSVFLNFMTLSDISTQQTYFQRYKDKWDLLVTVEEGADQTPALSEEARKLPEVKTSIAYEKIDAYAEIPEALLSSELKAIGGLEALDRTGITETDGVYRVKAPILVLDDASFQDYCVQAGIDPAAVGTPSAVVLNRIWDNAHSHFRNRLYLPFIDPGAGENLTVYSESGEEIPMTIGAYSEQEPWLREEYEDFALVQILSESAAAQLMPGRQSGEAYLSIKADSEAAVTGLETAVTGLLEDAGVVFTVENRQETEAYNETSRGALNLIMGVLCGLMALIGVANVFANILGHIGQRKREFARYLSVGMTPGGVWRMLWIEALVIGLKPILISLPFNVLFILFMVSASHLDPAVFLAQMPLLPLLAFGGIILAAVGLAYGIGGRIICRGAIAETLKDDTLF